MIQQKIDGKLVLVSRIGIEYADFEKDIECLQYPLERKENHIRVNKLLLSLSLSQLQPSTPAFAILVPLIRRTFL